MRLAEHVGINTNDITGNSLRLLGKGNKERIVYVNDACLETLDSYMKWRQNNLSLSRDPKALFLSKQGRRITPRRVEQIVQANLEISGLGNKGYSPHKLRHIAATIMYQDGNVDIRVLQEMLGHSNLGTTQIYTQVSNKQLKEAANANPITANLSKRNTTK